MTRRRGAAAVVLAGAMLAWGCTAHEHEGATERVRVSLARELAQRGDTERAFEIADEACRAAPRDGTARAVRGSLLAQRGLLDQAEADLKDAVRLAPDLPEAHAALGVVYERRNRPAEAEKEHRRAVQLAPHNARYLNNLGYALLVHGSAAEAVSVLERAAREDPMDRRIRNNLGYARARTSDFPRAAREFELGGTPAEARNNLGYAYELAGNMAQARVAYREALRLDPQLSAARTNLARVEMTPEPAAFHLDSTPAAGETETPTGGPQ
jgi:Flp pilus assembly protein TadD